MTEGIQDILDSIVAEFGALIAADEKHEREIAALKNEIEGLRQKLEANEVDTATLRAYALKLQTTLAALGSEPAQDRMDAAQKIADITQQRANAAQKIADIAQQRVDELQAEIDSLSTSEQNRESQS